MFTLPNCPKCKSEYTYEDGNLLICPECSHEWTKELEKDKEEDEKKNIVRDAHGNALEDGDSVTVVKDLRVRGSSSPIKMGTHVKNIRLIDPEDNDGHDIDCRVDGFGAMKLKSEFVKKL